MTQPTRAAPAPNDTPVLVLDGQSNPALACVRSLGRAGYPVLVASHVRFPLAAWSRFCRGSFHFRENSVSEFARLREWAVEAGARVVLPMSETTCVLTNAERTRWEADGITVGCAPADGLTPAFDKAVTLTAAAACGVRTPATHVPTSLDECREAARALGYPCVVKPRYSYRWDGTRVHAPPHISIVTHPDQLPGAVSAGRVGEAFPLMQEVVVGHARGVFALCDDEGTVRAWFAHEAVRQVRPLGTASSMRRARRLEPRLRAPAQALLRAMLWYGPAMVEFLDDGNGDPCLMEVNGRFWNSLALAVAAGVDFPRLWVELLTGGSPATTERYREDVAMRWLWGDVKRALGAALIAPPGGQRSPPGAWQAAREVFRRSPPGTRLEMWESHDRWPAVGEWLEAAREIRGWMGRRRKGGGGGPAPD
jgi:predicted ATP-grasp superfamily ATP-dependent carboligase